MSLPPPPPCSNPNPNQWRFTWETVAHIPTLRLYLFNPTTNPSARCRDLKASLQLSQHALLVTWIEDGSSGEASLRVPVPRVLIDPDGPVVCKVRYDHIEVKLVMVLSVDHPLAVDLRGVLGSSGDRLAPLSLDSELKLLTSEGGHFFCKNCSTRLTRQPLSCFVELPSADWRESADNWFGACCCSFGGISEKLVSEYVRSYTCSEGTCLLDSASVIVCKDDLEGILFCQCLDEYSYCSSKTDLVTNDNLIDPTKEIPRHVIKDIARLPATCVERNAVINSATCREHSNTLICPLLSSVDGSHNMMDGNYKFLMENLDQLCLNETHSATGLDSSKFNHCAAEKPFSDPADGISEDHCHCCADEAKCESDYLMPAKDQKTSLGSGFISRTSNLSDDVKWVEFSCRNCSATLGSYPSLKTANDPVDGGVRLFKCYISTDIHSGDSHDMFRKYTLERVFVRLLLEGANEELSFRIIIRDLETRSPMLQIVLLNSESWLFTGDCLEDASMRSLPEINLQPVVKVLFSEASSRIEDWLIRTHTEEAYMMASQIEELTKCLKSAVNSLPTSCSSLQGMSLSFMER